MSRITLAGSAFRAKAGWETKFQGHASAWFFSDVVRATAQALFLPSAGYLAVPGFVG
jgi:hypothetical protein